MPHSQETAELELSIIMPCLNEAETLGTCIRKAQNWLRDHEVRGEIIVGDNGSTDGSQDIARALNARLVEVPIRGYGAALFYAASAAQGKYIIMGDSDDSYDFSALTPFLERLRAGYDLVMGNRFKGGVEPGAMPWKHRYLGNPVLTGIGRLFFRAPCKDFHCGLRGFSREAFTRMALQTTGMEFASEMVIKATLLGMKIAEVSTVLHPDGRSRPPHLRSWHDGWRHLRFMLLYSPRWLFLYPGLLLMLLGTTVGILLLRGPIAIGGVTFDANTLFAAAIAILSGFQAANFAVLSKVFAITEGLLPPDPRFDRAFRAVTLEVGLAIGAIMMAGGLGGIGRAVVIWGQHSFGPLAPAQLVRLLIPSGMVLALGFQVIMSSFFLSLLGMGRR